MLANSLATKRTTDPPKPSVHIPRFSSHPAFPFTILPNGWAVALLDVTPELATEMLSRNVDNQRQLKTKTIERYASDMSSGDWRLTHQGVAFDAAGHLCDGQHRLSAVVASSKESVPFFVFFGVGGRKEMTVLDTHQVRTDYDASKVLEMDSSKRRISILNAMIRYGIKNGGSILNSLTRTTRLALLDRHKDTLRLVDSWFGTGRYSNKLGTAPVIAAVACAALHHDHGKLERFVHVLTEQVDVSGKSEFAAKSLRQFLTSSDGSQTSERFLKTCRAIQHFIAGVDPGRNLYACPGNPFPIPGFNDEE
jgi:hypothetical protein